MQTVRDVLSSLNAELRLDADAGAIEMTPLAMFMMMPPASDYIINDGATYSADISFEDMILYANGESRDIIEQLGLTHMMDTPLDFLSGL